MMPSFLEGTWCELALRYLSLCIFYVYLVGKRTIVLSRDEHIKKGKRIIFLNLHCEFDMIRLAIEVV